MTLGQWLDAAERELTQTGSPDPRTDAEWMAVDVLGVSRSMLKMMHKSAISDQQQIQLDSLLSRRAKGEPLQYIEGVAWFMGLEFGVDPRVLIPRADTEVLCEAALELLEGIRDYAYKKFGVVSAEVLHHWGIHSAADAGRIVYLLIGEKLLSAAEDDREEDFHIDFDFSIPLPPESDEKIEVPIIC
jgi:uncharacterized repeat protein (TIGR04138 family)